MYIKKFGANLKELIGANTITSIAKKIGIPPQTLSRYLSGHCEIGLENLCKIADYFNEDLDIIVGRREY